VERIALDIETAPLPNAAELFDESTVKVGNLKDKEKIKAKIEQARKDFERDAALSWTTGQVTCICMANDDISIMISRVQPDIETEQDILEEFWRQWGFFQQLITYNGYAFDLQYIIMRSLHHGLACPALRARGNKYIRSIDTDRHIDLINLFDSCGKWISMEKACRCMLGCGKIGNGTDAIELFETGHHEALTAYCLRDAELTWQLWKKIGGE